MITLPLFAKSGLTCHHGPVKGEAHAPIGRNSVVGYMVYRVDPFSVRGERPFTFTFVCSGARIPRTS